MLEEMILARQQVLIQHLRRVDCADGNVSLLFKQFGPTANCFQVKTESRSSVCDLPLEISTS